MLIGINASFARKPHTGIGQVTLNFIKELARQTPAADFVLYLEEPWPKEIKLPKNFSTRVFLPAWKRDDLIRKIWWEKFLLPQKVKADRCAAFLSLYQCPTVISKKIKHLMVVHDLIPSLFPEYLNNYRKRVYHAHTKKGIRKADRLMAVSHRTEKDLIQHLGIAGEKITVNYIDADEIYKREVSEEKNRQVLKKYHLRPGYIFNAGGLETRKNVESVILAYHHLLERNKKESFLHDFPSLVIAGKLMPQLSPLVTDAEKIIKDLNLTSHVEPLDFVPQEDMPALYNQASVFVYPSKYEGFGLPVLEAMNQGVPVITAKTSSLPEVGGDGALYCNPNDYRDIAMVLKNALLNKNLRETLSRRGRERARYFSWEKFIRKTLNIISND